MSASREQQRSSESSPRSISIAMATYNGERYLGAQLDSLTRQSVLPLELVVTDDCSKDGTLQVLEEFARTAPFTVRVFPNEKNLGYADNFLKAASLCTGDLIAFCDQDDVWLENKLEVCSAAFADPEVLLCAHSGELWNGETRSDRRCPDYRRRETLSPLAGYPLQGSFGYAMVIRRDLLGIADNGNRFRPSETEPSAHDTWVWLLAAVFGKIVLLPDLLTLYRQHGANQFGGSAPTLGTTVAVGVRIRNYQATADTEVRCAAFLTSLAAETAPKWRQRASAGAAFMARCSALNRIRSEIYNPQASIWRRAKAFGAMCLRRGYSGAVRGAVLGRPTRRSHYRAAVKDALFGLTGVYKWIR